MNKKYRFCCPYCGGAKLIRKGIKKCVSSAQIKCFEEANDGYMYSLQAASVDSESEESTHSYVCDGCTHEWSDIDELRECGAVIARDTADGGVNKAFSIARGNMDYVADCIGDVSSAFTPENTYFILTDAVNIHGAAGGGLARKYADLYPNMDAAYTDWCHSIEVDRYACKSSGCMPQSALTQTVLCDGPGFEDMWDEYEVEQVDDGYEDVTVPVPYGGRYMGTFGGRAGGRYNDNLCLRGEEEGDDLERRMSEAAERSACGYPDDDWWDSLDDCPPPEDGPDAPAKVFKPSAPHPAVAKAGTVGASPSQPPVTQHAVATRKIRRRKYHFESRFVKAGTRHQAMFIMNTMPAIEYGIHTSYEAIVASLEGFAHTRYSYSNSVDQVNKVLVIPAVGCGIGGCSWDVVRPLLEHYASIIVANRAVTQIDHVIIVEPTCNGVSMDTMEIIQ